MNIRTYFLPTLVVLLAAVALNSCKSSSTPSGPPDYGGNTFPKTGTTYNFHTYQTDSTGGKVAGSDSDYTASVVQSGISYSGKTNVFQVSDNGANNYYTYEHNGDVDLYLDASAFGAINAFAGNLFTQWYTFPTSSHLKGLIVYDSTISVPIIGNLAIFGRIDYVGEESLTIGSESVQAEHCVFKISSLVFNYSEDVWFVSKIGYFSKLVSSFSLAIPGLGGGTSTGSVETMTSYSLK